MKRRFILYRRKRGGMFYLEDTETRKQESLGTRNRPEVLALLNAWNESVRQPQLNLHIARAYLAASDPGAIECLPIVGGLPRHPPQEVPGQRAPRAPCGAPAGPPGAPACPGDTPGVVPTAADTVQASAGSENQPLSALDG